MKRNQALWGGAGVIAAAVIVYFAFFSSTPSDEDISGAIGVAKQYRADQITSADVVLQDPEIQELLQSDFFYKLVTDDEFRKVAVGQLSRLDVMSAGRVAKDGPPVNFSDMKTFLNYTAANKDLKQALAEGKMVKVKEIMVADGKEEFTAIAQRIALNQGPDAKVNMANLANMAQFLDYTADNRMVKQALSDGRLADVEMALIKDGKKDLAAVARQVAYVQPDARVSAQSLADTRNFLTFAMNNPDMKQALAEGRVSKVNEYLIRDGKEEFTATAQRIALNQGPDAKVNMANLANMAMFMDYTADNRMVKQALSDGRLADVEMALIKDGKKDLTAVARQVAYAQPDAKVNVVSLPDMKAIAQYASQNGDFAKALHDGKLDVAAKIAHAANKNDISMRNLQSVAFIVGNNKNFLTDLKAITAVAAMPSYRQAAENPAWSRLLSMSTEDTWQKTIMAVKDGKLAVHQQ